MDYLGLSTLTIMRKACERIEQRHGVKLDLTNIPIHERRIHDLLSRGDVVVAALALFRTGLTGACNNRDGHTIRRADFVAEINTALSLSCRATQRNFLSA